VSVRAVDPGRSRIVLVGTPDYRDDQLPDVPQISANLADLAAVFADPQLGGFPEQHCVTAPPRASVDEIGDLLHQAAEAAEDLLLFYFAGHGLLGRGGELYLSLYRTRVRAPEYSALRFETVRGTFLDSPAANRAVIVDSCYSGRAIGPTLGGEEQEVLGQLEIGGTYTLASAPPNSLALVRAAEEHTAFTGRLLRLLREGSPQAGPMLSLGEIYRHLYARLRAEGLPLPQQRGTATADLLGLVRNRGRDPHNSALADTAPDLQSRRRPPILRERAEAALDKAVLFTADMKDERAKTRALSGIAQALATLDSARATSLVEQVERIAATITDNAWKPVALAAIAKALAARDPDRASDLFEQAERIAATITDKYWRKPVALAGIAKAVAAIDPDRATGLLEQAIRIVATDDSDRYALTNIAAAVTTLDSARAADLLDQVERIAVAITDSHPWAWVGTVAQVAAIDPDRAERLAATVTDEHWKCITLVGIAKTLAATDPDHAARLVEQAERLAITIQTEAVVRDGVARSRLLPSLTRGIRLSRRAPSRPNGPENRSSGRWKPDTLVRIAEAMAFVDPDRALDLLEQTGRTYDLRYLRHERAHALAAVAGALAATDPDRAERLAAAMTDPNGLARAWAGIAQALTASELDRALLAARRSFGYEEGEALAGIARALATSDPARAEYVASTITDQYWRPAALADLAQVWLTGS
jgi:hypothetical protein